MSTPSKVEAVCVDPKRIHEVWPLARHLIKSAIDYTGLSNFADIENDVLDGDQILWLAWDGQSIDAAATTHLVKNGERPVCILTACAGHHMQRWLCLREKIENYAKAENCSCIRIYGRRGWERVLPEYRVQYVILEKAF